MGQQTAAPEKFVPRDLPLVSVAAPILRNMDGLSAGFCFYDDPDLPEGGDADSWSGLLRAAHQRLWSKPLPGGEPLELAHDLTVLKPNRVSLRLSSDTIASTHNSYRRHGVDTLWHQLSPTDQMRYDRGFYTVGGFIVFPVHSQSLNQRRGTSGRICDRFDLSLECIRLYYEGVTTADRNPLGDVLLVDAAFFDLFGQGPEGFAAYVDFFYLGALVHDGGVRWLDGADSGERAFTYSPLPKTIDAYIRYLEALLAFVNSRNEAIASAIGVTG